MLLGALSGTQVLLRAFDDVGGVWRYAYGEVSNNLSESATAIDITHKNSANSRLILDGKGLKSQSIGVELVFNDAAGFDLLRTLFLSQTLTNFEVVKDGVEDVFLIRAKITSWNETSPDNDKTTVTVTLESSVFIVPPAIGSFYWSFAEGALAIPMYDPASADYWILDNAQAVAIGETVSFLYQANASPSVNGVMLTSADGAAFFGFGATRDICDFAGYTATLNGVPLLVGDPLPSEYTNPTPPSLPPVADGRFQLHTIVLTATVNTDVKILGRDFTENATLDTNLAIGSLLIVTAGQTYSWPMDTTGVAAQPEVNVGSNNLVIQSFNSIQWRYNGLAVESQQNDRRLDFQIFSFLPDSTKALNGFSQPSLRADGAGFSTDYSALGTNYGRISNASGYHLVNYAAGFTIEFLVKFQNLTPSFTAAGSLTEICSTADNIVIPIWVFQWDNYREPLATTPILTPTFTLPDRGVNYNNYTAGQNFEAEVRGAVAPVFDQIYHMLATMRPSDNTIEFWIDGVSQGTAAIDPTWWDNNGDQANWGLIDPVGATFKGSYTKPVMGSRDISIQDMRWHLLEADQDFVTRQYEDARVNV